MVYGAYLGLMMMGLGDSATRRVSGDRSFCASSSCQDWILAVSRRCVFKPIDLILSHGKCPSAWDILSSYNFSRPYSNMSCVFGPF